MAIEPLPGKPPSPGSVVESLKSIGESEKVRAIARTATRALPEPDMDVPESTPSAFGQTHQMLGPEIPGGVHIPPSLRVASPEVQRQIQSVLTAGLAPGDPDERERIVALAKTIWGQPKFVDRLRAKQQAGELGGQAKRRIDHAIAMVQAIQDELPEGQPLTPEILADAFDQGMIQSRGVGPERKVKLAMHRDLETGKVVIDVPGNFQTLYGRYYRHEARKAGVNSYSSLEEREKIAQKARDSAAKDIVAGGMRARNLTFWDPDTPRIEELAKSPFRGIKAFSVRHKAHDAGAFGIFTPTVEEVQKEGFLDWILRYGLFDYMAAKGKLIRGKLSEKGEPLGVSDLAIYAFTAFNPITAEIALQQLGVTPEEEVQTYLDGHTFLEEVVAVQGELAAMTSRAFGGSQEEQEHYRREVVKGPAFKVLPMLLYLFEPDLVTASLFAVGKGAKEVRAFSHIGRFNRVANALENGAKSSETTFSGLMREMRNIDKQLGSHAETIIVGKGSLEHKNIDKIAETLADRREAAEASEAALRAVLPETDVDNLIGVARAARDSPEVITQAKKVVEERGRYAGALSSVFNAINKRILKQNQLIKEQKEAKIAADSLRKTVSDLTAEVGVQSKNSPAFRDFVNADNIVIRLEKTRDAARKVGDVDLLTQATQKLNKARATRRKLGKILKPKESKLAERIRDEGKINSQALRKAEDAYQGDGALKALIKDTRNARTTSLKLSVQVNEARSALSQASRRYTVMDPKAAKSLAKKVKPKKGKTIDVDAETKAVTAKLVGDFAEKQRRLSQAREANKWREHALSVAQEYRDVTKVMRKTLAARGLIFVKTGITGAKADIATEILSGAVTHSSKPYREGLFSVRETPATGKRIVTIQNTENPGIILAGTVTDDAPDIFRINVIKTPEGMKGTQDALYTLRSAVEYAQRNNLGLDLNKVEDAASTLRAAGVPVNSAGKIGVEDLRNLTAGDFQAQLTQQTTQVLLDGRGLKTKLEAAFGAKAVDWILTRGGDDGKVLSKALESETPIAITLDQATRIQLDLANIIARRSILMDPANKAENLANMLLDAHQHWSLYDKGSIGWMGAKIRDSFRSFDPWNRRLGTSAEETHQIVRAGDNLTELAWDEYGELIKRAGAGKDSVRIATFRYLDTTARQLLPHNRTSVYNMGAKTIFQRAKRALVSDTTKHTYKHSDDLVQAATDNNPAILGLSRIWIGAENVGLDNATKLYKAAVSNLKKSSTAEEFVERQRKASRAHSPRGIVDPRTGRVHAFAARAFIVGSVYEEIMHIAKKASGGLITPEEAKDIEIILGSARKGGYEAIKDVDRAFENIHMLGLSFLEKDTQVARQAGLYLTRAETAAKRIMEIGHDINGDSVFALNLALRDVQSAMSGYIKTLSKIEAPTKEPWGDLAKKAALKLMSYWRTDAVTGLMVPNAGKITFDKMGDASQVVFSSGATFAARVNFQNVWLGVPRLGVLLQDRMSKAAREGKPVMRTFLETTVSPHIDNFWKGKDGAIRVSGVLTSYDAVRKRAITDGITDSRASVEVIDLADKLAKNDPFFQRLINAGTTWDAIARPFKSWQEMLERYVQGFQQRQRVGTWLLHLHDGKSFDEATRITRESLYDWRHGLAQAELLYQLRMFPFIRWGKLTGAQIFRKTTEHLTKPALESLTDMARGKTGFNRLRVMYRAQRDVIPYLMDPRSPEEIAEEDGYFNAAARALVPRWIKTTYPILHVQNHDKIDFERNVAMGGDAFKTTHSVSIGPPNSIVDFSNMMMSIPHFAMFTYLALKGETAAADDLWRKGWEPITGMMYPTHRAMAEDILGLGYGQTGIDFTRPARVNAAEAAILETAGVQTWTGEDGQKYASPWAGYLRAIPGFSISLPRLLNSAYYRNPGVGRGAGEIAKHFALAYTRVLRTYQFNVFEEMKRLQAPAVKQISGGEKWAELEKQK